MKKLFVFILALIVAAGSVIPCCINDDCMKEQTCHSSKQDSGDKGACSPFFTCGSCTGFVQMTKAVIIPQPFVQQTIHHQKIIPLVFDTYHTAFFQPPRLTVAATV